MATKHQRLTVKRQRFVAAYLRDPEANATRAAIAAGFARSAAHVEGSRLLSDAKIQAAIEAGRRARTVRMDINADWVIMRQVELHAKTVDTEPEVARKVLRDIGDGIGLYVERVEHALALAPEEREARVAALLGVARQRALMAGQQEQAQEP